MSTETPTSTAQHLREVLSIINPNASRVFLAPGRVNIIGEHTDYNDGFVLPMAIDRETLVAIAPSKHATLTVRSLAFNETASLDLHANISHDENHWFAYIAGIVRAMREQKLELLGCDLVIASSVPLGAGLSSSAALEIAVATALLARIGQSLSPLALARLGQRAEHLSAGTLSGIMDQLISTCGSAGQALLIDCQDQTFREIPATFGPFTLMVSDSRVKHQLAFSAYNQRRAECQQSVERLQKFLPNIGSLRDVTVQNIATYGEQLGPIPRKRAQHVVSENQRTLAAADALSEGDYKTLGGLMCASHQSLRDDYEVSCSELDFLVATANALPGVVGSRMTGGGFGGSTVSLVETSNLAEFSTAMTHAYQTAYHLEPVIFPVYASAGAHEV